MENVYFRFWYVNTYVKTYGIIKTLKRVRSKEDERKVCIELTEQGKDLKEKACSLPTTMATNLGITEQEYRSLLIQLNKLIDTMKTINDGKGE